MAKVKFGMMMVDARGKLGGQVFSKNRSGSYVRTKVTPSNPQTTAQTAARLLFATISAGWSALTASARAAWNAAVDDWATTDIFGDLKNPSGKALYQRLNNQAQAAGLSAVTSVPAKAEMPDDVVTAVAIDNTADTLTLTGANASASTQVVVFATGVLTPGTKYAKNRLRQIYAAPGDTFSSSDAYAAYVAKFGEPAVSGNVKVGVKYVLSSGQASPLQVLSATVS